MENRTSPPVTAKRIHANVALHLLIGTVVPLSPAKVPCAGDIGMDMGTNVTVTV